MIVVYEGRALKRRFRKKIMIGDGKIIKGRTKEVVGRTDSRQEN